MKVHRTLGPGFLEMVYQKALTYELRNLGFQIEEQKAIKVFYDDIVVGDYVADMFVNDELIVEIKAVRALATAHELQTVNYLPAIRQEAGLLLNFGAKSLEFKKKFRTYREPVAKMNSENSVNSVKI